MSEQIKDDGGPVFPIPERSQNWMLPDGGREGWHKFATDGISLRDYAAIKAMQSILLWPDGWTKKDGETWGEALSRQSYEYADAMLQARSK